MLLALLVAPVPRALHAQVGLNLPVDYPAGWNLVGVTDGTLLSGAADPIYEVTADGDELPVSPARPLRGGHGYWAYFPTDTRVTMPSVESAEDTYSLPAGRYTAVGNPVPALVSIAGADAVYTYNPIEGYHATSELQPGQAALAFSQAGGAAILSLPAVPPAPVAALALNLRRLLLHDDQLPNTLSALQPTGVVPLSNAAYVRRRPNAIALTAKLDQLGRQGGLAVGWQRDVEITASLHTPLGLTNVLSLYNNAAGAHEGLALVFSDIAVAPLSACEAAQPLALPVSGDESLAQRIECSFNQIVDDRSGTFVPVHVTYVAYGWRSGSIVMMLQLSSINESPDLDVLMRLVSILDDRLNAPIS